MGGLLVLTPVVLAVGGGAALVVVLALTALRASALQRTVAAARRHGASSGAAAVIVGLAVALAVGAGDPARPLGPGVSALLAPLAFAAAHTAVLLVGEATWPRPRGTVRSAALAARTTQQVAPRWLLRVATGAAGAVAVLAATGWVTAAPDGRSVVAWAAVPLADGGSVGPTTAGPYPGAVFAVPALVGLAVVVVLALWGTALVVSRPAVDTTSAAQDEVLRRASAHRLLRGACAGLLVTAGGLALFGGAALRGAAASTEYAVDGVWASAGGDPLLVWTGTVAVLLGGAAALAGIAVLLVPAPRLGADSARRPSRTLAEPA